MLQSLLAATACCAVVVQPSGLAALQGRAHAPTGTVPVARSVPSCPWKDVAFTISMDSRSVPSGRPILLRSTVTNHDSVTCSVTVGHDHGYDPSQVIVTRAGKFVWDACDVDNQQGACSNLWMLRDLRPGGSYTLSTRWNQRWGQGSGMSPGRVPPGRYVFGSGYADLIGSVVHNASASITFRIVPSC